MRGKMTTLYDIAIEFKALEDMLLHDDGEVTQSHEELEKMAHNLLVAKTDNYVSFVQKLEDEIELASTHIKRIQAYKKSRENAIERLKAYALNCMNIMKTDKIIGQMGQISTRKPIKALFIEDKSKIPEDFCSYERIVDESKVKDALKQGDVIEGASLIDGKRAVIFKLKGVK